MRGSRKLEQQHFEHVIKSLRNDAIAEHRQVMVALPIAAAFRMLTAVDLNDELHFATEKIGVVVADRCLPDEFITS